MSAPPAAKRERARYLVGIDDSPAAVAALRCACAIAEGTSARVDAVHALPVIPIAPETTGDADVEAQMLARAARGARLLVDRSGVRAATRAEPGDPAEVLCTAAAAEEAALIAVGTSHRGRFGRLVHGSVAERLVHGAPCAVAVVPPAARLRLRRIAVAYDGRPESEHALAVARELALALGGELILVAVDEPLDNAAAMPGEALLARRRRQRAELERRLDERRATLDDRLRTYTAIAAGRAGPALTEFCRDGVDVVVCGSRGFGPLHAALAGSTSRHLADHAPCPVVVVPRGGARSVVWAGATPAPLAA